MSSNIQEDMMIIVNKKTSVQILEKRIRLKIYQKVNRWMEYNHSTIFFPLYNNERYIYDNKIRYGLDKNDKIILIQIEDMNNSYKDVAYIFYSKDEYQYTDGINYKTDNDKVVIYYDSLYEICEDQTIVLYSSKLDSNDNNKNKFEIVYNENQELKSIRYLGKKDVCFYQKLNNNEIEKLKSNISKNVVGEIIAISKYYSKENGMICFIGLEYFYDGEAIDLGVRIGLESERHLLMKKWDYEKYGDIRNYGGDFKFYQPLLDVDTIQYDASKLFQFLKRENNKNTYDELKSIIDIVYNELITIKLNEKINVTKDFIITEPFIYD